MEKFVEIEGSEIPLFIGSQFGVHPIMKNLPKLFNGEKIVAILGTSLLSGCMSGLKE